MFIYGLFSSLLIYWGVFWVNIRLLQLGWLFVRIFLELGFYLSIMELRTFWCDF